MTHYDLPHLAVGERVLHLPTGSVWIVTSVHRGGVGINLADDSPVKYIGNVPADPHQWEPCEPHQPKGELWEPHPPKT